MGDMICDDRLDVVAMREFINSMTDEEFETYLMETYGKTE